MNYFASMERQSLPSFDEQGRGTENAVTLHSGNPNLASQSGIEFSTAAPKRHRVLSATYQKGQARHHGECIFPITFFQYPRIAYSLPAKRVKFFSVQIG